MENNIDKIADMIADKALDEFTYKGKSLREWVELMVKADSVVEVRMVEELEKAENKVMQNLESMKGNCGCDYRRNCIIDECMSNVRKTFKELKGETNV